MQDPGSERMMILVLELVHGEVSRWKEVEGEVWAVLGDVVGERRGVCVRFYVSWGNGGMGRRGVARRVERPPLGGGLGLPPTVATTMERPAQAQVLRALDSEEERARFFGPYRQDERGSDDEEDSTEDESGSIDSSSPAGEGSADERHSQDAEDGLNLPNFATVPAQPLQSRSSNPDPYPFLTAPMASSSGRTSTRPRHAARDELLARISSFRDTQRPATRPEARSERRAGDVFDALRETLEIDVRAGEAAARRERAARAERRMRELGRGL